MNQFRGSLDEDASVAYFKARFAARAPAPAQHISAEKQLPNTG